MNAAPVQIDPEDIPARQPQFGFQLLADVLTSRLMAQHNGAFVLGIHGPWGSGKTTLMDAIRARLPKTHIIVEFNAWKYQAREALWRALILRVLEALRDDTGVDQKLLEELQRSLYESFLVKDQGPLKVNWTSAITEAVVLAAGLAGMGVTSGFLRKAGENAEKVFKLGEKEKSEDVQKRVERVAGILQRVTTERSVRQVASIEQFLDLFRKLTAQLSIGRRVYVLIDDLDRCLPEAALDVFEAAKLFLDSPECRYVVAVDRAVIRRGLALRYPLPMQAVAPPVVDADEYIEKTITLSFDLPALGDLDAKALLGSGGLKYPLTDAQMETVIATLGTNPRRLKRFAHTLAVWQQVAERASEVKPALLFSPLEPKNVDLFLKLTVIGYINSAVIAQMQRDPDLVERLQRIANSVHGEESAAELQVRLAEALRGELVVIREAGMDPVLWRALKIKPNLSTLAEVPAAMRWFRSLSP